MLRKHLGGGGVAHLRCYAIICIFRVYPAVPREGDAEVGNLAVLIRRETREVRGFRKFVVKLVRTMGVPVTIESISEFTGKAKAQTDQYERCGTCN